MSNLVTKEDVKKVANLGRLYKTSTDEQLNTSQKDLNSILEMVQKLSDVDLSSYSPHSAFKVIEINDLRADEPNNTDPDYARVRENILANFPARQGDLLQLPIRIIEEN